MQEFLEQLEIREAAGRDLADRLRTQIAELTTQLAAAEKALERLRITRETILEIAPDLPGGLAPLPSAYRQILALFEDTADGLRPKDVCIALDTGTEPRHVEGVRAKLKRLVSRGILTEPEPGLFRLPQPTPSPD
ncbi:hypothetical protein EJC51_47250 [Streptomyces aquilus]|uniref:Uncharacterized protein n=1 Tax=Streptomyces aquilus TaxID=2548456 RepID=A0A3Q9C2Y3_9ACTN|nr:hypothetical protein [Streptomyces aquilus]AZP23010.1 hypothetical protein EJC51_00295 [Streptomyces aquilus]AZP23012.1 hypothetical protein EJC51_00395 [Streptomyces aquilus]AZP23757.1 hypothetical protein EJC51_46070 [Streptomyces aquilus]AZP23759.1 hypothetical protein EJC51_46170 [Streptomyces aquilus]AZP23768.1 hypothetical protein EJC51_46505 [Streptomyces aquilus]